MSDWRPLRRLPLLLSLHILGGRGNSRRDVRLVANVQGSLESTLGKLLEVFGGNQSFVVSSRVSKTLCGSALQIHEKE